MKINWICPKGIRSFTQAFSALLRVHLWNRNFYGCFRSVFAKIHKSKNALFSTFRESCVWMVYTLASEIRFTYHWKSLDQNSLLEPNDSSSLVSFAFFFPAHVYLVIPISSEMYFSSDSPSLENSSTLVHYTFKHTHSLPSVLFISFFHSLLSELNVLRNLCHSHYMMMKKINSFWRTLRGTQELSQRI